MTETYEDMCRYHLAIYYNANQITKETETLSLMPRWCRLSGKCLWGRRVTKLTREFCGSTGVSFKEKLWVDSRQLVLFKLRDLSSTS